jgi:hypothetical protein
MVRFMWDVEIFVLRITGTNMDGVLLSEIENKEYI